MTLALAFSSFDVGGGPTNLDPGWTEFEYNTQVFESNAFDETWSFDAENNFFGILVDEPLLSGDVVVEYADLTVIQVNDFPLVTPNGVQAGQSVPFTPLPGKHFLNISVGGGDHFTVTASIIIKNVPAFTAAITRDWFSNRLAVTLSPFATSDFWLRKKGTEEPTVSRLKKLPITTRVAAVLATPGTPGTPGRPATPARTILVPRTVSASNDLIRLAENMARTKYYFENTRFTTAAEFNAAQQAYSDAIAAYNFAAKNINDTPTITTVYDSVFIPAQPATPAVPGTAGTAGSAAKTLISTNAGFNSSGSTGLLPANVALEFVVSRAAVSVYAGFSATQGVVGRRNVVWGFYFERGTFKVVQNSVLVGSFLPFDSGDTFTVVRANGQIRYLRNNLAVAI